MTELQYLIDKLGEISAKICELSKTVDWGDAQEDREEAWEALGNISDDLSCAADDVSGR